MLICHSMGYTEKRMDARSYPQNFLEAGVANRENFLACDVSGSEEELRLVVGEEGRMPAALLLVQGVDLALESAVGLDGPRLACHLQRCSSQQAKLPHAKILPHVQTGKRLAQPQDLAQKTSAANFHSFLAIHQHGKGPQWKSHAADEGHRPH